MSFLSLFFSSSSPSFPLFFIFLFLFLFTPFTNATPSPISECQSFTVGGEFYLSRDLTNATSSSSSSNSSSLASSCLLFITTDPVTLDGRGYTIRVTSVASLEIRNASSVVIQNLITVGSGIQIYQVPSVEILNVTVSSGTRQGIAVYNSASVSLTKNVVESNTTAVVISKTNYASVQNNVIRGGSGLVMDNIALGYILVNTLTHFFTSATGISCTISCGILNIRENTLVSTLLGSAGINVYGSSLTVSSNQIQGYATGLSTRGVTTTSTTLIDSNSVQNFSTYGIISYVSYATIRSNVVTNGMGDGIRHEAPEFGVILDGNRLVNITSESSRSAALKVRGQFSIVRNNVIQRTSGVLSMMLYQATSHTVQNNLVENVDLSSQFYSIYSVSSSMVFENNIVRQITHSSCDIATVVNFESMLDVSINNCTIANLYSPPMSCGTSSLIRGMYTRSVRNVDTKNVVISNLIIAASTGIRGYEAYDDGNTTLRNFVVRNIIAQNSSTPVIGVRVSKASFATIDNVIIRGISSGSGGNVSSGQVIGLDVITANSAFISATNISEIHEGVVSDISLCINNNVKAINLIAANAAFYNNIISNVEPALTCATNVTVSNINWQNAPVQGNCQINPDNYCSVGSSDCCIAATCTMLSPSTVCRAGYGCNAAEYCSMGYCPEDTGCDECATNTDECDPRATCTNTPESYYCNCTSGYFGNGFVCQPYCGDGVCDPHMDETCVSCPHDCPQPCDMCGDGHCNGSETCSTCHDDCGDCGVKTCGGTPLCYGHGTCGSDGVCICSGSWYGPYCDVEQLQVINVAVNNTQPAANITIPGNDELSFQIKLNRIEERNQEGFIVDTLTASQITYSLLSSENSTNTKWQYNASYSNDVNVSVTIWLIQEPTTVEFAGVELNLIPRSLKINVRVATWPFRSSQNFLAVIFDVTSGTNAKCILSNEDEANKLNWRALYFGDFTLYGTYLGYGIVDGLPKNISFKTESSSTIVGVIPHFWTYAEVDPSYSVLAGSAGVKQECTGEQIVIEEKSTDLRLLALILLPVLGGLLLISLIVFFVVRKMKISKELRKSREVMEMQLASTPGYQI